MINYTFTTDDIQFIEKAIEIKNKGWYIDGGQLTEVYNRVLNKRANPTSCGSCIRQRICELETALNSFKKKMANSDGVVAKDSVSDSELTTMKEEAENAVIVQTPQENKPVIKRAGRPKKK